MDETQKEPLEVNRMCGHTTAAKSWRVRGRGTRRSAGLGNRRTPRAHRKGSLYGPSLTVSLAFQNFLVKRYTQLINVFKVERHCHLCLFLWHLINTVNSVAHHGNTELLQHGFQELQSIHSQKNLMAWGNLIKFLWYYTPSTCINITIMWQLEENHRKTHSSHLYYDKIKKTSYKKMTLLSQRFLFQPVSPMDTAHPPVGAHCCNMTAPIYKGHFQRGPFKQGRTFTSWGPCKCLCDVCV